MVFTYGITRYFSFPEESSVSFTLWQNRLIFCKHAQWLKSKWGVWGNRKISPSTGFKIERSGFCFFLRHPTWPWTSQLQMALGTSANSSVWLMWGLGGGLCSPLARWGVSSWYQPLAQPLPHTSCSRCCLHNYIRFCETKLIPVCMVLGLHGQAWKCFLFKLGSG